MNSVNKADLRTMIKEPNRRRRGRSARRKGNAAELANAKVLQRIWPAARRGRDPLNTCDIEGTPLFIECEQRQPGKSSIKRKWKQAVQKKELLGDIRHIAVIVGEDYTHHTITMELDTFIGLLLERGSDADNV